MYTLEKMTIIFAFRGAIHIYIYKSLKMFNLFINRCKVLNKSYLIYKLKDIHLFKFYIFNIFT